jgi:porphobilinogen synthase
MLNRPRRNRKNKVVRAFAQETQLGVERLIYPLFVLDGKGIKSEVKSLPGNYRWSLDTLLPEVEACMNLGINSYVLFPAVADELKDKTATYSYAEENFYLHILRKLKETFPEICLMTDVAMDPYSSDGHDGFVNEKGEIVNDKTLGILANGCCPGTGRC